MKYFKGTSSRRRKSPKSRVVTPSSVEPELATDPTQNSTSSVTLASQESVTNSGGRKRPSTSKRSSGEVKAKRLKPSPKQSEKDNSENTVLIDFEGDDNESDERKQTSTQKGQKRTSTRTKAPAKSTKVVKSRKKSDEIVEDKATEHIIIAERAPSLKVRNKSNKESASGRTKGKTMASRKGKQRKISTEEDSEDSSSGIDDADMKLKQKQKEVKETTEPKRNKQGPAKTKNKGTPSSSAYLSNSEDNTVQVNEVKETKKITRSKRGQAKTKNKKLPPSTSNSEDNPEVIKDNAGASSHEEDSLFDSEMDDKGIDIDAEERPRKKYTSSIESNGNMSLEDAAPDKTSDRQFLQNQVALLRKPFELEDCIELATQGSKSQQKKHIPQDTVKKALRRLNHNMEDELLKHLNRQAQMKLLKTVAGSRLAHSAEEEGSSSEREEQVAAEERLEVLRERLKESREKLNSLKELTKICGEIETKLDCLENQALAVEVKQTNKLVDQIAKTLKNLHGATPLPTPTSQNKFTGGEERSQIHKKIVDKLFGN